MEESNPSPSQRSAYLPPHARSQASVNWRQKDDTPRADPQTSFRNNRAPQSPNGTNPASSGAGSHETSAGTRLYIGNLLYTASRDDVENLFTANGFNITGISMSIDPFTGRNPSYAFVDFETAEEASKAMDTVNGMELLGREVKVNPGVRRQPGQGGERRVKNLATEGTPQREYTPRNDGYSPSYNRWTRTDGATHSANANAQGLRLYVGNLPRIEPQSACEETIQQLFASQGFQVAAVSKIISPHPSKAEEPGNHHYCFVDMNTLEDVEGAVERLNGVETEWGLLRVGRAKDNSGRKSVREGYERREGGYERREGSGSERRGERTEELQRSSWR
ncbi:uncharacterized protein HMPREF1541_10794 [Cyphellophora europaea CBS 101466]|uniref:RRM domain-containing protein n=1 Tax=Cyphellophora europaea (strain CBS 101466) TaxID=1220924 RepID=W2S861_CYPE1|nr:uncharacterized protein HMPREF1541_10794 [Cyphellophora europaea CBS 101466]ETN44243.1 hypothetical protein HMPREF1541_10794 [Cyphellophora europaea CBS 101466]